MKVKKSKIQGKGVFTDKSYNEGGLIGESHSGGQPSTDLGKYYNHSDNPNSVSMQLGGKRYVYAKRPLKKGEEVTLDYRQQPELEQPEDFKGMNKKDLSKYLKGGIQYAQLGTQVGGIDYPNQFGFVPQSYFTNPIGSTPPPTPAQGSQYNPLYQGMNPNQSFQQFMGIPPQTPPNATGTVTLPVAPTQVAPTSTLPVDQFQSTNNAVFSNYNPQQDQATINAIRSSGADRRNTQNKQVNAEATSKLDPTEPKKTKFADPYGGYDIPTAAYLLGENIEQGDGLGTVAAAGKVLFGTARNLLSGMGNARRNQFVANEARENYADSLTQTQYAQLGGSVPEEVSGDTPAVNLGKYKGLNYFDVVPTQDGVSLRTTEVNPHNADTLNELLPYLQQLNPNTNLGLEYVPKMQEGGEAGKLLTGDYVTGLKGAEEGATVEVEEGEWMKFPSGDVSKVIGDKHNKGGEKMNVAEGTQIISDFSKIGGENAKRFRDEFDIKVKAKETWANVIDKYNKKIGLNKLTEEQEDIIKEIENQKEVDDKSTFDLNMQLLSTRMNEIEEEKRPLEALRAEAFDKIFEAQEAAKEKENPTPEMKLGGMVTPEIKKLAEEYGIEPERALELLNKFQGGGTAGGEQDRLLGVLNQLGIRDSYQGLDTQRILEAFGNDPANLERYFTLQAGSNEGKGDDFIYTPTDYLLGLLPQEGTQTPVTGTTATRNPNINYGAIDNYIQNLPISDDASLYGDYKIDSSNVNTGAQTTDITVDAARDAMNVRALPDQTPRPPSPLQPQLMGEVRLGRLEPTYVSPEGALTEQNRQFAAARDQINKLPDSQRQAAIASLLATTQGSSNQAISQAELANQQAQMKTDQFNIGQRSREDILNLENALAYEAKVQRGLGVYEQSVDNYFNAMQQNQLGKYNEIQRLNLLNQLYDNFQFTGNGIEQTASSSFSAPGVTAKFGGKVSRKIQDYLKK